MKILLKKKFIKRFYIQIVYYIVNYFLKLLWIIIILSIYNYNSKQLFMCKYNEDIDKDKSFFNLSKLKKKNIILLEKEYLLNHITKCNIRKVTQTNLIFLDLNLRFGNQLILLNKVIFYCEILGCKKIILNKKFYWFIKNKIIHKKYKISIEISEKNNYHYYNNIIIDKTKFFFWHAKYISPQYRTEIIKNEIIRNIPIIKINHKDIFIYIRSGDIFERTKLFYIQPPLCFYKCILNNFKYKRIYIISENSNNPVINKLLIKYPYIIYNKNSLKYDISYLLYANNIVGAYSTFLKNIIQLNDNIKLFWIFEFYVSFIKSFYFSYNFNHKNAFIYKMESKKYYKEIYTSTHFQNQINLMLNFKCNKKFVIIKQN